MWDKTVKYVDLSMVTNHTGVEELPLPAPYSVRFYRPGDERHWARIETSAGEFDREEDVLPAFERYYGARRDQLSERMLFLLDGDGRPVGTATAWFDEGKAGHLHWVAIDQENQRKGLARPLVQRAMWRMHELGDNRAILTTQTPSWVAVKVYLGLGWRPYNDGNPDFDEGWRVIREKIY